MFFFLSGVTATVKAAENDEAEQQLQDEVQKQLDGLDMHSYEEILANLEEDYDLFDGGSFYDKVKQALNGGFDTSKGLMNALFQVFFSEILKMLPIGAVIAVIAVLGNLLHGANTRPETGKMVHYACLCGVLTCVCVAVISVLNGAKDAVTSMQTQMNLTFPVLLTMMSAIGSVSSVAVYQPMVALLSYGVSSMMTYLILPLFVVTFILHIVSAFNTEVKLSKLADTFSSSAKWLIGIVFTVFSAFLSIQGIYSGVHDGVSFRTAKYAISHYVPIVGGYLSDGLNMILAGSMLVKNAVGLVSVLLLVATILSPLVKVLCLKLILMFLGAILEPLQNNGISTFLTKLSKSLNLLIAVIVSVAFMYFISLVLMICSANYVIQA